MFRMTRPLQGYLCPLAISLLSKPSAPIELLLWSLWKCMCLPRESVNDSFASDVQSDIFDGMEHRKRQDGRNKVAL